MMNEKSPGWLIEDIKTEAEIFDALDSLKEDTTKDIGKKIEAISVFAARNPYNRKRILDDLYYFLGPEYIEKILDNSEYRKEIAIFERELAKDYNGVLLMEDINIKALVAVSEMFGTWEKLYAFIESLDLKSRIEAVDKTQVLIPVLHIDRDTMEASTIFPVVVSTLKTDDYEVFLPSIETTFDYQNQDGEDCDFCQKIWVQKNASGELEKRASLSILRFPESFQSNGFGKELIKDLIIKYKELDVARLELEANIAVGGYAWAVYGFGWNKEEMSINYFKRNYQSDYRALRVDLSNEGRLLSVSEEDFNDFFSDKLGKSVGDIFQESLVFLLNKIEHKIANVFLQTGCKDDQDWEKDFAILKSKIADNTLTPQDIAVFKKEGPFFYNFDYNSRFWWTDEELTRLAEKHPELSMGVQKSLKHKFHLGKMALYGSRWFGQVELNDQGEQKGRNLKMLMDYLNN